jgi:hypothetical protein
MTAKCAISRVFPTAPPPGTNFPSGRAEMRGPGCACGEALQPPPPSVSVAALSGKMPIWL